MGFLKKRIILKNSKDLNQGMAVLTLEQSGSGNYGNLKIYNISVQDELYVGISSNGIEALNTKLNFNQDNTYSFKLSPSFDINANISCVIVKKHQNTIDPIVWGSNSGDAKYKDDVINIMQNKYTTKNNVSFESVKVYETNNISKLEDNSEEKNTSKRLTLEEKFENSEEEIEELIDQELGNFYTLIKEQIDELFNRYPKDVRLSEIIPNSSWVRVDYEGNGHEYVVGLIKENDKVKFICYGVPSKYNTTLPDNLEEFSQWIPLDSDAPEEDGFYLMFQDAITGDSINLSDKVM